MAEPARRRRHDLVRFVDDRVRGFLLEGTRRLHVAGANGSGGESTVQFAYQLDDVDHAAMLFGRTQVVSDPRGRACHTSRDSANLDA